MPKVWRLRGEEISDVKFDRMKKDKAKFPSGTVENFDPDFLARCHVSTRYPGCIEYGTADGQNPWDYNDKTMAMCKPTFMGLTPKRAAYIAKVGTEQLEVPGGIIIRQTCGNDYCVNQQHLVEGGVIKNKWTQ